MRPSRSLTRWAALLNRTLVLPHLLGRGGGGGGRPPRAAFGRAYDLARARTGVSPVELIEIDRFAQLGIVPERLLQLRTRAASGGGGDGGGGGGVIGGVVDAAAAAWGIKGGTVLGVFEPVALGVKCGW